MLYILLLGPLLLALYLSKFFVVLVQNYFEARKSGFPLVIVPVHPNHVAWLMFSVAFRGWMQKNLPTALYERLILSVYGWEYHERRIPFRKRNTESIMIVTCGRNEVLTIDPEIIAEVAKRPQDFHRSGVGAFVVNIFGTNLLTSEGEAWARQRKLITGIINERISKVVFEETWRQSRGMVRDIESEDIGARHADKNEKARAPADTAVDKNSAREGSIYAGTFPALKRITSNVLFRSAYGLPQDFKPSPHDNASSGAVLDMLGCIEAVITDIVPAAIFPTRLLINYPSFLPGAGWARRIGRGVQQFPGHVEKRLDDERKALNEAAKGGEVRANLTSMLVQASEYSDEDGNQKAADGKQQRSLTEDELRGNLFIFTIAGFETTANALTFALMFLMAQPVWQEWLFEEIDELFAQTSQKDMNDMDGEDVLDYATFYPKAIRCLALMNEVLRLYPPVVHLDRTTDGPQVIKTSKKTYYMPTNCGLYGAIPSLHVDPKVWRGLNSPVSADQGGSAASEAIVETMQDVLEMTQDEYVFRPSRWVNEQLKQMPDGSMAKSLFQPPKGTYIAFSSGPRVCPGQKMAQVEFVCVILSLFKDYKIEAVRKPGESDEKLQQRLQSVLKDTHSEVTVVMDRLNEVDVRFVKRG